MRVKLIKGGEEMVFLILKKTVRSSFNSLNTCNFYIPPYCPYKGGSCVSHTSQCPWRITTE